MGPIPTALGHIRIMTHGFQGPIRKSLITNSITLVPLLIVLTTVDLVMCSKKDVTVGRKPLTNEWTERCVMLETRSPRPSVHENHRTWRTFPMARPICLMRDFTNLIGIYKAHQIKVWWTMKVFFQLHCLAMTLHSQSTRKKRVIGRETINIDWSYGSPSLSFGDPIVPYRKKIGAIGSSSGTAG